MHEARGPDHPTHDARPYVLTGVDIRKAQIGAGLSNDAIIDRLCGIDDHGQQTTPEQTRRFFAESRAAYGRMRTAENVRKLRHLIITSRPRAPHGARATRRPGHRRRSPARAPAASSGSDESGPAPAVAARQATPGLERLGDIIPRALAHLGWVFS